MSETTSRPALLSMTLGFDRRLVWERGNSVRYLIADITAPPVDARQPKPKGLNFALVLDASGSMSGMPLESAKQAAIGVVERLTEEDRLSVISFATDVITHVQSTAMSQAGRSLAMGRIAPLTTRGSTDLCSGWLAGSECVARDMAERPNCRNRVVLLSDGHANHGICDQRQLSEIASNLRNRGLFTSTVGIGDGYSPFQLQAIAESGGGRMHDAERPQEIIEVVLAELNDVQAMVAENVVLEVEMPAGVHVEVLGTFPLELRDGVARCAAGSLLGSARRRVVLKVKAPAGKAGQELVFSGRLNWQDPGSSVQQAGRTHQATLRYAAGKENSAQGRDIAASVEVARLWQSMVIRRVVDLNRDAAYDQGTKYLAAQIRYFEKYCRGLPGADVLVAEIQKMSGSFRQPWHERSRKEMELAGYRAQFSVNESRREVRMPWADYVPEPAAPRPNVPSSPPATPAGLPVSGGGQK